MSGREVQIVEAAFATNWLSTVGPNLAALEGRFAEVVGVPGVAVSSGTAAMHLGMRLLGIGPGDEVVSPTLTFAATCNPVLYQGGKPVFIDSDPTTWNLDPSLLEDFLQARARVNRLPKAVTVVHLYGQSADMDAILGICGRFNLPVLEDAAHAVGTLYKGRPVGGLGAAGVFSLGGNKVVTATCGGMFVSPRVDWVEKARFWSTQARDPDVDNNYVHSELGYNYRLSNLLAGIALAQLDVLDVRVRQRRAVAYRYRDALAGLPGIELMPQAAYGLHTNWLSCFLVDAQQFGRSATQLVHYLDAANVEARPVWRPMHTQPIYHGFECVGGAVAEDLNRRGICLPSSSSLSEEEQQFVIDCLWEAHRTSTG